MIEKLRGRSYREKWINCRFTELKQFFFEYFEETKEQDAKKNLIMR